MLPPEGAQRYVGDFRDVQHCKKRIGRSLLVKGSLKGVEFNGGKKR